MIINGTVFNVTEEIRGNQNENNISMYGEAWS